MSWSQGWGEVEGVPGSWLGKEWALGAHAEPCVRPQAPEDVSVCGGGHSCTVGSGQEWGRGVLGSKAVGGGGVSS